jgi:PTS system nitrogen regulatory IIA component
MNLSDLLDPQSIHLDRKFHTIEEVLQFAAKRFATHLSCSGKEVLEGLLHREQLGDNCICDGVLIPHTRIEGIEDICIEVLRLDSSSTVTCKERKTPVRYAFVIVSSKKMANQYLRVLKAITELTKNHLDSLDKAVTPEEFLGLIEKTGITIEEPLVARDIASPAISISFGESINRAVDIMKKNRVEHLAVIDNSGNYVGTVDFVDLLKSAFPDYVFNFPDLSFLNEFEPLREFLIHEAKGLVKDYVIRNPEYELEADESYVNVVYRFVRTHQKYCYITSNGHLLGIITVSDLISKLLRA